MADNFKYVQAQPFSLAGAGAVIGATSITLKSFTQIDGTTLTMTNFGTIGYGTLEPGNGTLEEQISFSGVTQNANGTATLTGVKTVLFVDPYTETSGLAKTHAGSTVFVLSNTAGFYAKMTSKSDDETITGIWTFTNPNYPKMDAATPAPVADEEFATKKYVDDTAIAGAPKATDSVYGITKLSVAAVDPAIPIAAGTNDTRIPTQGENDALVGTAGTPSSSNKYVTNDDTTGTGLVVRASVTNGIAKFGGDGSDGALTVSSGTTNIDLGGSAIFTKNYTSISITGTGAVTFSNPHSNGTIIKLLSQGAVTLTSSATPMLDARGCGAAVTSTPTNSIDNVTQGGTAGTAGVATPGSGAGATGSTSGTGGAAATSGAVVWYTNDSNKLERRQLILTCGTAGRNGAAGGLGASGGAVGSAGTGGTGGGVLYIECKGALNFTTALGISVAGNNGTTGGNASTGAGSSAGSGGGSGGSGGSAGMCLILYNTLTANSGTITVSGGNGGNGGNGAAAVGAQGGSGASTGGASGASAGGGAGGLNGAGGGSGGAGGAGGTPASSGNAGTAASAGTGGGGGGGAGGASGGSGGAGGNGGSGTAGSGTGGGTAGTGGTGGSAAAAVPAQYGFGGGGGGGGGHGGAGGSSLVAKNVWFA